jgi:tetratricopeptide (TPR) repeat protein/predicted Ser/Thr protein kinase
MGDSPVTTRGDEPCPSASPDAAFSGERALRPGAVIDRFIVHRTLGMGGTGVVYAAHDPELDRTVALKVLRRDLADRREARMRFLREAQAMARLSHPNVISIYDVRAADGLTFIAMECIHGHTFDRWIEATRPSWPQLVAVLVKAGRGLAAAHSAGLIHRDFKPANLLVSTDGRVVVTDFGLARAVADDEIVVETPPAARAVSTRRSVLAEPITLAGKVQGTPAYMAPEQREGRRADERADQFSFCVTLYEALFGVRPFMPPRRSSPTSSSDPASAEELVSEDAPPAPADDRGVPPKMLRAVQRGLQRMPEDRYPDMESLLAAIARGPKRMRRRAQLGLTVIGLTIAGTGIAAAVSSRGGSAEETCTGADEQMTAVWNRNLAGGVRASFAGTGRPHASSSSARAAERIDAYASRWKALHRSTCLATARGEQSPNLLDRRMACLSRRLAQLRGLVDLFVHRVDGELVDRSIDMVARLEPLDACADSAQLLANAAPSTDPVRRAHVVELERRSDMAELERRAGRPQVAADGARAVLDEGKELDDPMLAAQAGRVLGRSLEDLNRPAEAREALVRAQGQAGRAGHLRLAADLMLDILVVVGLRELRYDEARLLGQVVESALEHPELRDDQARRARLLEVFGNIASRVGESDRAIELQSQVLAIRRRILPAPSEDVAKAESYLADALANKSIHEAARVHYLEALAIRRQLFGADHPLTANVLISLGILSMEEKGDSVEAREHFLAALAVFEKLTTHRNYSLLLQNLGTMETSAGNCDRARGYLTTALAVRTANLGPDHPEVGRSLQALGAVAYCTGDFAQALSMNRRALAIFEKSGPNTDLHASGISAVGETLRRLGKAADALGHQTRALQMLSDMQGHPLIPHVMASKGLALHDLGRRLDAIPVLERALEDLPPGVPDRAFAAFALARALEPRRPRSARAKALAREALTIFTATGPHRERGQVSAYLAASPSR